MNGYCVLCNTPNYSHHRFCPTINNENTMSPIMNNVIVTYFNFDTNTRETKKCHDFHYSHNEPTTFSFTPVDEPIKTYKNIIINNPITDIKYTDEGDNIEVIIQVNGFQWNTSISGYERTVTIIKIIK